MKNKVLIIGTDHHNTLGLIRSFGKEKVDFKILMHGDFTKISDIKISRSKYAKKMYLVSNDEESILSWLINNKEPEKMVIIPGSDLAEYTIDKNYNKLKDYYIIPGFKNKPGKVCKFMDKYEQVKWANENNIPVAKSWSLEIENNKFIIPNDITFPCVVKPQISALGHKGDIKIAKDKNELKKIIDDLFDKKYNRLLLQSFINKVYEADAHGCIIENEPKFYGGITKKIIEIPSGGSIGSTIFGQFIEDEKVVDFASNIILKLQKDGYRGLYDIEIFVCEDKIYLNEINLRHSGQGYTLIDNGINAPYIWYLDTLNINYNKNQNLIYPTGYYMNEIAAIQLIKEKKVNIRNYLKMFKKSFAISIYNKQDLKGSFLIYWYFIKRKIKNIFSSKKRK